MAIFSRSMALLPFVTMVAVLAGCDTTGLRPLSGTVTYEGRSIPTGSIMFEPESAGAPGAADISDGRFRTRNKTGVANGFYQITIYGFDPDLNKDNSMDTDISMFFPYTTRIEITSETKTLDIVVPKGGGPPPQPNRVF